MTPDFPAEVEEAAARAAAEPRLPELDRTDLELRHDRPAVGHGPRPGAPPRAGRRRLRRPLRDRRRGRVRVAGRPGRRGGAPSRRDALRRRLQGAAPPEGRSPRTPARCCPTRTARRCSGRSRSTRPARAPTSRSSARWCAPGRSSTTRRRSGGSTTAARPSRCSCSRRSASCGSSARPPGAGCRCRCPSRRSRSTATPSSSRFRSMLPVEQWNAQISLLTGFAAASLMVYARVGLLRTLPPPDPRDVTRLHRTARALGIEWPAEQLYPDFIRTLDPGKPEHAAMVVACTRLLRGSGYVAFDGEMPGRAAARGAGLRVRPRHRAAAPARRPLRRRDLRRAVRRRRGARLGPRAAPRPARHAARVGPAGQPLRARRPRPGRGGAAPAPGGRDVPGRHRRGRREDHSRGTVTVEDPAIEARVTGAGDLPLGEDVTVSRCRRPADVAVAGRARG